MPANTPTQAVIGYGSRLACEFTTGVFTDIAECRNIGVPQSVADKIDATNQDSPNRTKESVSGMIDPGEANFELNWLPNDPTQDETTGVLSLFRSGATKNWRVTTPGATLIWTFPAYVNSFQPNIETQSLMTVAVGLVVNGASTFA